MQVSEQLDSDFFAEPIGKPMLKSALFHVALVGGAAAFTLLSGILPHHTWGGTNDGDAIAVQLVSSALPLPADHKPNDNVLATENPSEAPAPPTPKSQATVDTSAIPIPTKVQPPKKTADKHQEASKPLKPVIPPPILAKGSPHTRPNPQLDNRAQFGEQSSTQMQRSTLPTTTSSNGQAAVTEGTHGFNYPYYVEGISRRFLQYSYRNEVDPHTPTGSRAYILFTIRRDGSPTDVKLDRSSGSPTLDRACLRAAQRVDTYGPLPSPPSNGNLSVSYYCDY